MTKALLRVGMPVLALLAAAPAAWAGASDEERPPHAVPGQCYEKFRTAEVYETVPERRLVTPERIERRLIPAEFGWRDRTVVVRPASVEHQWVPPVYRTVNETVVVQPPTVRREVIPAIYEPVARQVLVREARTVWKPGRALPAYGQPAYGQAQYGYAPDGYGGDWRGQTQVTPTGEIMCLVVEPALYRTVVEQVLRQPERVIETPVPPVTRLESRQVVDRPGYDAAREIPAEYGTVREKVVVRPERDESYTVPAIYSTVETRRLVSPARTDWRPIACATPPAPPPPPPPPPPPRMISPCATPCAAPPPRPYIRRWSPPPVAKAHPPRVHRRMWVRHATSCTPCAAAARSDDAPPPRHMRRPERPERAERADQAVERGRPMVQRLQSALAERGYYKGPADGQYTPPTRDALVRFQRDKGLNGQGELTRDTADALNLGR